MKEIYMSAIWERDKSITQCSKLEAKGKTTKRTSPPGSSCKASLGGRYVAGGLPKWSKRRMPKTRSHSWSGVNEGYNAKDCWLDYIWPLAEWPHHGALVAHQQQPTHRGKGKATTTWTPPQRRQTAHKVRQCPGATVKVKTWTIGTESLDWTTIPTSVAVTTFRCRGWATMTGWKSRERRRRRKKGGRRESGGMRGREKKQSGCHSSPPALPLGACSVLGKQQLKRW